MIVDSQSSYSTKAYSDESGGCAMKEGGVLSDDDYTSRLGVEDDDACKSSCSGDATCRAYQYYSEE